MKSYVEAIREEQMDKLIVVGFTKEQAEVLLEMMQTKVFDVGFL